MMNRGRTFAPAGGRALCASAVIALVAGCTTGCTARTEAETTGSNQAALTNSADAGPALSHLLVLVRIDAGSFTVVSTTTVAGPVPKRRGAAGPTTWTVQALSVHGAPLLTTTMDDPRVVRAEFVDPATGLTSGTQANVDTTFAVRVPLEAKTVQFMQAAPSPSLRASVLGSITLGQTPPVP